MFQKPMSVLSLRTAVDMDHNDALKAEEIRLEEDSPDPEKKVTYLMPAMDFHERRHEHVLKEAAEMDLVLDGRKVRSILPSNLQSLLVMVIENDLPAALCFFAPSPIGMDAFSHGGTVTSTSNP